jgi:hypothetical protein
MEISLTARLCNHSFEKSDFEHHYWRRFGSIAGVTPFTGNVPATLNGAQDGVSIELFKKGKGPVPGHECKLPWRDALDVLYRSEHTWAHAAAAHLRSRSGLNPLTTIWDHDTLWLTAEKEAAEAAGAGTNADGEELFFSEVTRSHMKEKADEEFYRQYMEAIQHALQS